MNALDIVLLVCVACYALAGYRRGFLVGSASTIGLLGGGFAGVELAPRLLDGFDPGFGLSVTAFLLVLVGAFGGQAIGRFIGSQLRRRVTWRPARVIDALSGSALSVVAMLLIAWVLGVAASGVPLGGFNAEVRGSTVLGGVDKVLPGDSEQVLSAFNSLVDSSKFPRYLEPFVTERIQSVPAPSSAIANRAAVASARASVVKVLGVAASCGRTLEGTGFVYRNGRVMTNAHVVAGVDHPVVRLDGTDHRADVVYYDPSTDIAVLHVPDLTAPALMFGGRVGSGDSVAVLGYPENGPYDVEAGRVRDRQTLRSVDIYGDNTVSRDTYSIRALVRRGNSGGPLVTPGGRVVGVVFAASIVDARTGYALTAQQVAKAAVRGESSNAAVDTGGCAL